MPEPRSAKGHPFGELSYAVIGACIEVQRQLGVHCMEVDYQRALELALRKRGLEYQREVEVRSHSMRWSSPNDGWTS